ncbi:MAG: CBS domain-containing protein [Planctomycetes bacterium]|nr:CBS domain-containing protein [Planctomycetota bacterium]
MSKSLITVGPKDTVERAVGLLRKRGIRHLLVMRKNRLVGIISDRDIKRSLDPSKTKGRMMNVGGLFFLMEPILISEIMTHHPITISPSTTATEAADLMIKKRINALPVVDKGRTVGIVTETDLLKHYVKISKREGSAVKKKRPAKKVAKKTTVKKKSRARR